jgi:hypothetical protein
MCDSILVFKKTVLLYIAIACDEREREREKRKWVKGKQEAHLLMQQS